jgi:hypothetical protein
MATEADHGISACSGEEFLLAKSAALKLLAYCRQRDWAGYDPYDALNSRLYENLPILHFRLARLVLTQGLKRCPFDLRPLLLVPKTQNPKGLALFLSALLKLSRLGLVDEGGLIRSLAERLEALRSPGLPYSCWGYSFPWQTRTFLVERWAPNLVSTAFVANAFLDLFKECKDRRYLELALSAADYLLNELYWTESDSAAGFRYPSPRFKASVHNANFLGAALLCRVAFESGERRFMQPALRAACYSAHCQRGDGSWAYGESSTQSWVDGFHTGYNLCALMQVSRHAQTDEFDEIIRRGLRYYREQFFSQDGAPRYFHDRVYPLDVHSAAQGIITLVITKDLSHDNARLAGSVFRWCMARLWDNRGYFYYQQRAFGKVKIPYMRWGQAWMLLGLAFLLEALRGVEPDRLGRSAPRLEEAMR